MGDAQRADVMKKMMLVLAALSLWACAPATDDAIGTDEVEEAAGKADRVAAPLPFGTFDSAKPQLGEIRQLTVKNDRAFSRWIQVVDCIPLKGCTPETGTVHFTRNLKTGQRFIRFYDADGDLMDRYQYTFDGAALTLRRDDATDWTPFTIAAAAE
jgi:hypothetical protein